MKKTSTLFLAVLSLIWGFSQEVTAEKEPFKSEISTTDRGAYTKTGENIKPGIQFELGLDYQWTDSHNPVFKTDVFSPIEGTLRLGLSKYVEVDFSISNRQLILRPWDEDGAFQEDKYGYWSPMEIGVRAQFIDSKKKASTDGALYLALSVNNTMRSAFNDDGTLRPYVLVDRPSYVTPEISFFFNHNLGERFVLGYNAGLRWTGIALDGPESAMNPDFVYSVRLLAHACERLDFYAEHFNAVRKLHSPTLGMNLGSRFALSRKFTFDINAGLGFNKTSPDGFAGLGISYKLGR